MKRKWIVATVGAAAAAALVTVGTLWAQQPAGTPVPARPAASPRTKIALLNLTYVISYYEKYKSYKDDMKKQAEPFEAVIKGKQVEIEALRKEGLDPKTAESRRQDIEKLMKADQRAIEDANNDAKMKLGKEAQDQMVVLYREVQAAAQKYAAAHDFDMVMQYNEPIEKDSYYSPANVERKMGAAALIPLHYSAGMEISQDVLTMLNASYRPAAAAPAATTPGAATPTP